MIDPIGFEDASNPTRVDVPVNPPRIPADVWYMMFFVVASAIGKEDELKTTD